LPRAESRVYSEAKALAERGLVRAEDASNGQRPRTVYAITDEGREALRVWLAGPVAATRLECEALLRLLAGRLATTSQLVEAASQVRADADDMIEHGRAVAVEYLDGAAPFQDDVVYRALVFDFLFHHADMLRTWADRAEATIESWHDPIDQQATDAALARIRELVSLLPPG
jgi:PadR family transcriptional regulator AphA